MLHAHIMRSRSRSMFHQYFQPIQERDFKMKSSKKTAPILTLLVFCLLLLAPMVVSAQEVDGSIAACLKAWGTHPFGQNPQFKTLQTSVKVFGIGKNTSDTEITNSPSLVLVNPGVNVMGGTVIELLNPNGWYCLRTTVNVMGGVNIRAHCKAHLASTSDGTTVMGNNSENKGVTVMGSTNVERIDCN
jgi:hypothetical protein